MQHDKFSLNISDNNLHKYKYESSFYFSIRLLEY